MTLIEILGLAPVMPVLVIDDEGTAVDLAGALLEGGLGAVEITLRTPAALPAVRRIADELPAVKVGTGTVLNAADLLRSEQAGAAFAVSPGATRPLLEAASRGDLPLLPGMATPSEGMTLLDHGFTLAKLFPATAVGGLALLQALHGPLPQLRFCPTGGITADNARTFLSLPNVVCVGGSWVAPKAALAARDWPAITRLAAAAAAMRAPHV